MKISILLKRREVLLFSLLLIWLLPDLANGQSWYNTSWSYRKMITIDYTKVGSGPHTSFPVLISRVDADLQTKAQTDADDILFTSSDGTTKLDHEVESYASGTGTLVAWVDIPSLSSSVNTVIFMYYGNGAATAQQNITATWNSTYKGVWHLNNSFLDATSNNYDGTNTGTTNVTGKISNGRGYVRADGLDYITITGLMSSPTTFTMSGWATLTSSDPDGAEIISMGDCSVMRYDELSANKTSGIAYNGASAWSTTGSGINYAGTGWHYVVYTFDNTGNSQKLYVDGAQVGSTSSAASPVYTGKGTNTFIGKHGNGHPDFDFDGTIDEVHVSNTNRSAGWVLTEYNNQNSPSTFYSVGGEAKIFYSLANSNWNAASTWSNTGHAGSAASTTPGSADGDYVVIGNNDVITLNVNVTTFQTEVTINSTGTLNMGTFAIGDAASFTLNSGGTLGIGSTAGITSSGATGNVQVTGSRTFNSGSNYNYNGTSPQVTGNGLPATVNNLTINNSAGVTLSASVTVNSNLTVTSGVFTVGALSLTVMGITTVSGTLTITSATGTKTFNDLTINGTFNNTAANVPFTLTGNLQNNGTFNGGTGRVTFTGAASNTISGTAASTAFNGGITVNKGASSANVLDVQSVIALLSGGLSLTNGTFKLSSASVITPFTANISSAPFLIPATAGLWCNGGTINTTVSMLWSVAGLLRISAGTLNQGLAADDRLQTKAGCSIIVEGGNMNCAARISNTPVVWSFAMTGGILTIGTAGNSLPNLPAFHMDQLANSFSMSGGTMIIERPGGSVGENLGFYNLATSGTGFTGGTLQIGDASTPAGTTIKILSTRPIYNLTVNSANVTAQIDSFAVTTVSNNVTISAGTLDANNFDFNVGGNWTKASAAAFLQGTGTVTFNGSGTQSINGTATSQTFNYVIVAKTAGSLLNTGGSTTTLTTNNFTETTGDFTAPATMNINAASASSRILNTGVFTAGAITYVTGDWTNNGGTFTPGSNTVVFNGSGPQAINGTAASQTFYNLTIAKTAGTLLSTGGSTISLTTNDLTETTGNFTAPATLNINGNLLLSAGTFSAGTTTNLQGNWTNNSGGFTSNTYLVNFIGTATKTLGGSSVTSFYNLTINTSAAADIVQLTKNVTVTSILNLSKGVLDLNSKSLSVTNGVAGAITRTSGYILSEKTDNSGKIIWSIGSNLTSHTFPFGTAGGSYIPFIMNLTAGDIGNVTLSTYPTASNNTPYPSAPVLVTNMYSITGSDNSANTVDRFWQINKDGASGTATITFTATSAEVGTILFPTAQRYESSTNKWQTPLSGQTNTATSATVPGVTSFSPWTMSSQAALLPIQLVSFSAVYTNPFVLLNWITESEINSEYFSIERTTDESTFETISQVKAAGQSIQTLNYQTTDKNPSCGLSYYRLKQVDLDGTASYSDLVAIEIMKATDEISISPNPVTNGMITIKVQNHPSETLDISVVAMNGQIVFATKNKTDDVPQASIVIDQLGTLPRGLYILKISGSTEVFNKKITIY